MEGDQNSKNASNEDYMGAWGDEIPDFLQSSAPAPSAQPKSVKKGKQKGKGKKNKQKLKKAPVPKPIVEETKQVNEIPQASTTMEPDFEAPAPQETIQKVQQKQKPIQPEPSSTAEVAKEETNVEGKELNMEENKQNIPIENQSPAENAPEESPEGATQEAPEEDKKEETEEERKKREEKEKRAKNIEILEKQIQEEESMMFDWGNLEETMEKQKFIDSLKEELYYLKNPNKKRKKKKKAPKNNKKLMVNILKPQMSKNTIVKEQLMTEKSVKLCNDPDFEVSNIKLDKLQKGMFNRSNNCFMNVILQSLYSIPVFYNFLAHLNDQIESNPLLKDIFDRNSDDNLLIANFLELAKCFSPDTGGITNMLHYGDKVINVEEIFKTLLMNFNPDKQQQDCHEFLGLMLDTLNNELNEILEKVGISTKSQSLKNTSVGPAAEEWEETGKKKLKIKNKAEDLIKNSPIFEIFGGCMREDINVEGKHSNNARVQPYLYLSLPITMECSIDSSLKQYFEPEELEGFKFGKKDAYATKKQSLLTIPNILILHVKRFIYTDRAVKTGETIYYPDILELQDEYFAPELQEERKNIRKEEEKAEKAKKDALEAKKASAPEEKKAKKKKSKAKAKNGVKVNIIEQSEEEKKEMNDYKHLEKYELIGVIVHKGTSVLKGHYVTFVKDAYGNWVLYDDKECKNVTANLVLDQQAYVLIYRKF